MKWVGGLVRVNLSEWHHWFAWYPVVTYEYFEAGGYPIGIADKWVWWQWVWRVEKELRVNGPTIYYVRQT